MAQFNQFNHVQSFQTGRSNALSIEGQEQNIAREAAAAPVRNQIQALGLQEKKKGIARTDTQNAQDDVLQKATIINQVARVIRKTDPSQWQSSFESMRPQLETFGIDTSQFGNITAEGLDQVIAETQGFISDPSKLAQLSAGQREFENALRIAQNPNSTKLEVDSARRLLGDLEKKGTATVQERLGDDPDKTERVASSQAKIRAAIKQAEVEAKSKGEVLSGLNRAKAALPGLQEVVTKLKQLADVATFTTTGKVVNVLAKELFGTSTEGGTARTTMRSVVDNQVLPLLRDTFGAAFTEAEGEKLRNTLLDPDTAPEEMKATLDSFIEQKIRNIETSEREIGQINGLSEDQIQAEIEALKLELGVQ